MKSSADILQDYLGVQMFSLIVESFKLEKKAAKFLEIFISLLFLWSASCV